jgi:divalent metal cation (Fe/Co/Zn/Cd) transporter
MIEQINTWLAFLGWGKPHLLAIVWALAASTVVAWVAKYPLRLWSDARGCPLGAFKWSIRTLAGLGAFVGAALTWPERGRYAYLGGLLAWVVVLTFYKLTGPLLARFAPWISSDHIAKIKAIPDDTDDSGV